MPILRIGTLNIAHGRGAAFHQSYLSHDKIMKNLIAAAALIHQSKLDVIALQEIDVVSSWSGSIDQPQIIAQEADFSHKEIALHTELISRRLPIEIICGTALLSRLPLKRRVCNRFACSWRDNKGYVAAQLPNEAWVISVHLDFLSRRIRHRQISVMLNDLKTAGIQRPIILGDLNSGMGDKDVVTSLCKTLNLVPAQPQNDKNTLTATYPAQAPKRRLDWILVPKEFSVQMFETLPTPVSDHLAVVSELVWE